jgi:hypothetical protein
MRRGAAVALLMGPSPLRPKEVYLVRFRDDGGADAGGSGCRALPAAGGAAGGLCDKTRIMAAPSSFRFECL